MLSSRKTIVLLTAGAGPVVDGPAQAAAFSPKYIDAPEVRYSQFHLVAAVPHTSMPAITAVTSRGLSPFFGSRKSKNSHSAPRMRAISFSETSGRTRFTRTKV